MTAELEQKIKSLRTEGKSFREIAKILNISKTNAQYHCNENNDKEKFLLNQQLRRRDLKLKLVKLFGGQCSLCGYKKSLSSLDFHHKDPSKKDISISQLMRKGYGEKIFDRCLLEAKKCILVCSNCHHEIHDEMVAHKGSDPFSGA